MFSQCILLISTAALGSKGGSGSPVYVDLAYIPNHCSGKTADQDFFRRVRASYYVVSGNDPANGEPSRAVLDALLEGKAQWGENLQVSSKRHKVRILSKLLSEAKAPIRKKAGSFVWGAGVSLPPHLSLLQSLTSGMFSSL